MVLLVLGLASLPAAAIQTSVSVQAGSTSDSASSTTGGVSRDVTGSFVAQSSAAAAARAGFGSLGVSASGSATHSDVFPGVGAAATASFWDTLLISGTPDALVSITLELVLDGACTSTDGATGGFPNAGCQATASMTGLPNGGIGLSWGGPRSASETIVWGAGHPFPIAATLSASGFAYEGAFAANFYDTLHVYAFTDTPGSSITSESGHDYSPPTASVPEPTTLALTGGGLLAAMIRRRRHRRSGPGGAAVCAAGTCTDGGG
jgi:hypothetical protein